MATKQFTGDPVVRFIEGGYSIAYRPNFAKIFQHVGASLLMSQLFYWSKNSKAVEREGWFYKTAIELQDEIGMYSRREFETSRKVLIQKGVIDISKGGIHNKSWYRVNHDRLVELAREYLDNGE